MAQHKEGGGITDQIGIGQMRDDAHELDGSCEFDAATAVGARLGFF